MTLLQDVERTVPYSDEVLAGAESQTNARSRRRMRPYFSYMSQCVRVELTRKLTSTAKERMAGGRTLIEKTWPANLQWRVDVRAQAMVATSALMLHQQPHETSPHRLTYQRHR